MSSEKIEEVAADILTQWDRVNWTARTWTC